MHPAVERAHQILARRGEREAAHERWRASVDWNAVENEALRLQREAEQQAETEQRAEAERHRQEWASDVAAWREAQAEQPQQRVLTRDWHSPRERAADEEPTLLETAVDVIADEVHRALQAQRCELWAELERLRAEMQALREARS